MSTLNRATFALALAASVGAVSAHADCSKSDVMKAVQHTYGKAYTYASDYYGNTNTAPTYKQTNSVDQYLFWVDKAGTSYKAVVTDRSSGKPCTGLTAWVDVKNGQ